MALLIVLRTFALILKFDLILQIKMGSLGFCYKITPSLGSQTNSQIMKSAVMAACLSKVTSTFIAPNLEVLSAFLLSATVDCVSCF